MKLCPRCGQPLVRDVKHGKDVERCTRCSYRAWIVPLEHTKATRPKYGDLWPANDPNSSER